ncbi:extracellular solute-binding protein [Cohnella lubricantis]|uniref:Extracellular solute-binding protein n=1 Tax=Cohnella lubricantis TaxID=2163172 RepID=A0A841TBR9_9BACL|nr:extracellular solute-binding protein [Cohnella lubricantis]MBB6675881.1 extracellular solute-binding protein [Cohnella lubricantis]MBP2117202.1 putative aldouronate transport system substrate-binding protein [Cohnella lubricantis]
MSRKLTNPNRRVSSLLAGTMILALLAACSGNNGNNGAASTSPSSGASPSASASAAAADYGDTGGLTLPIVSEPTEITWMLVGEHDVNDLLVAKEIEKRTGIKVNFQTVSSAQYQDKLSVTLASGDLPDIVHGVPMNELKEMGQEGAVVAINDYADQLPNFKKLYVDENPWVATSYGDENGKMYSWPIYELNRDVNHGFMYRKDILDANNIEPWTDTESFYQVLKKLKEIYPDSYPYASKNTTAIFGDWAYGWGIGSSEYPLFYDESDGQWKLASHTQAHKDQLDFMKKLYTEGLIDPEFITDTSDSWTSKMTTDRSFVTWDWIGRLDLFYNQVKDANPNYDLRYGLPVGPTGHIRTLPKIDGSWGIAVSNNKNKEISLKLLDYLTSPSGSELITIGVEGVNFEWDANGKPVYPELADVGVVDITVLSEKYGMWLEGAYLRPDHRSVYFNYTEKEQEAQDLINEGQRYEAFDPLLNFTADEVERIADLKASIKTASEEFNTKYILDPAYGESQWNDWVARADSLGVTELVEIYNAAQARYDAAQ